MKRRTIISTVALIAVSGCTSSQEQMNGTNTTENDTSNTNPQETSSLNVVSVTDSPQIPEEYQGEFKPHVLLQKGGEPTVILEIPESNQLYISQELSLPNPAYVFNRDVTVSNESEILVKYSAEDTSPPDVAAPSVIQPTIDTFGIELSDLPPNTTLKIQSISGSTTTHETTDGASISEYN